MPEAPKRTSGLTPMIKAVESMDKWKTNVMFVLGLAAMGAVVYWFVFPDEGHEHGMVEMVGAGGIFVLSAFFAFPLGITRFIDKFMPGKWRK